MQKAKKKVIFSSLSWLAVARGHSLYIAYTAKRKHNMTKTKVEALANFVKAEYSASRFVGTRMKREKVVASRGSLKWARCSAAVVCSHAVPPEGRRKAFADYLVSASDEVDAEATRVAIAKRVAEGADD